MEEQMEKEQRQVVDVQFRPGQKVYFFDPNGQIGRASCRERV